MATHLHRVQAIAVTVDMSGCGHYRHRMPSDHRMLIESSVDVAGRLILILEDEAVITMEMREVMEAAGGTVVGPVACVREAMRLVNARPTIDAAILDIRLSDGISLEVAQKLKAAGISLIFVTGYDGWTVPDDLDDVPIFRQPNDPDNVVRVLFDAWRSNRG